MNITKQTITALIGASSLFAMIPAALAEEGTNVIPIQNGSIEIERTKPGEKHCALDSSKVAGLGIECKTRTAKVVQAQGKGAMIYSVRPGSQAKVAGLKKRDIITHVGDQVVESVRDLRWAFGEYKIGQKGELTVIRKGQQMTVPVVFQKRPGGMFMALTINEDGTETERIGEPEELGIAVKSVSEPIDINSSPETLAVFKKHLTPEQFKQFKAGKRPNLSREQLDAIFRELPAPTVTIDGKKVNTK